MLAYKGFRMDLSCTSYGNTFKYEIGVTAKEPEANCVKNGFHCAEDPLDCFKYYPNIKNSRYCLVAAEGDVDEDGRDSKISCTELTPIKELNIVEMLYHAILYYAKHPDRMNEAIDSNHGKAEGRGWVIVKGVHPVATARRDTVVALIAEAPEHPGMILQAAVKKISASDNKLRKYTIANNMIVEV